MSAKKILVTGGAGFIGASLVSRLVAQGHQVRVLDNLSRGSKERLGKTLESIELVEGDICDPHVVQKAAKGMESVFHLAFINGTEFFYSKPELVLDVGVRGMLNVMDACREFGIQELVLASSSEVYQSADKVPTDESVSMSVPDPMNPRYSYGSAKIISEILALHSAAKFMNRVIIFRPHNVYGPMMGFEHVIPQLTLKLKENTKEGSDTIDLPIQGTGEETRAFIYIDDFTDGVILSWEKGESGNIYHIGTMEEISIADLIHCMGEVLGKKIQILPGPAAKGGTQRRCPDTAKIKALGFKPKISLKEGLQKTMEWYMKQKDVLC